MGTVVVVEYDPAWPARFEALRARIWPAVADLAEAVEHVGSTSVKGLAAKPIIDLDVIVPSAAQVPLAISRLGALGYAHLGDRGIPGREAFRPPPGDVPHHLYLCPRGSLALANHLAVRDRLRADAAAARAYGELKRQFARRFPEDLDAYVDGKTELLLALLSDAGFDPRALEAIGEVNRLPGARRPGADGDRGAPEPRGGAGGGGEGA